MLLWGSWWGICRSETASTFQAGNLPMDGKTDKPAEPVESFPVVDKPVSFLGRDLLPIYGNDHACISIPFGSNDDGSAHLTNLHRFRPGP